MKMCVSTIAISSLTLLLLTCLQETATADETLDAHGVAGWDKVEKLAKCLLGLTGLGVTNSQASEIQQHYNELPDFDKWPVTIEKQPRKASKGRFGRSKSGHVGVEQMKRYFPCPFFMITV